MLADLLAGSGYQIETALNGAAALMWLKKMEFDTIFLDVILPSKDGFETCKQIRTDKSNEHIPIIFLTAQQDIESITEGFRVGGVDYLTKPFKPKELLARLATHIELKLARDKMVDLNTRLEAEVSRKTLELQESKQKLEQANFKLHQLDQAKYDFLKAISHEIRTPLNGICGSLSLLQDYTDEEYFQEVIALLDASVTHLENYSYAALQIANLQIKGDEYLGFQKIDLGCLAQSCIGNYRKLAKEHNIELSFHLECETSPILADMEYLQDAINALINSSLVFTKTGLIKVSVGQSVNTCFLRIDDTGCLFSSRDISHFFESLNSQNYKFERNNAIELHLAAIIIQLHKGTLSFVNNELNTGTITTLKIPIETMK